MCDLKKYLAEKELNESKVSLAIQIHKLLESADSLEEIKERDVYGRRKIKATILGMAASLSELSNC